MGNRPRFSWIIAACLSGSGCAVHRPNADTSKDPDVAYHLELHPGPPVAVQVTMEVQTQPGTTSRLAVAPQWGGVENCERFIHELSVRDAAGHDCPITAEPNKPHGWTISHSPGAKLTVRYELRPGEPDPLVDFSTHYEPVIRNDLLHLIGETGFVYPEWLEDKGPVDIRFSMTGFREHGWLVATSFGAESGRMRRPLQEFRHAMYFAGHVRIHDRQIRGGKLRVAVYGDDWQFKDDELVDMILKIVSMERRFMNDYSDPYFLVTIVPTGPRATPRSYSLGGTGLTNCFAMFLPPGTAVGPDSPHRTGILRLLAHEYFHTWNGGKIALEEPEEFVYWFSEGFTDFYASRLLRRAELIDDSEWLARLNDTLKNLWLSPVATEPAEMIRKDFWKRQEVQKLPYHRGEIVALMLDEEIRRATGGRKSLDDFMLEVLAAAKNGEKSQPNRLMERISRWTSPAFADGLRRIVIDGGLPDPPREISEPTAVRVVIDNYRYDPGFDIDRSLKDKSITGVREKSAAHAAGLRDGQAIKGVSIYHGDPDHEIEMTVKEGEQLRVIKYYPHGEKVSIPRYEAGEPSSQSSDSGSGL